LFLAKVILKTFTKIGKIVGHFELTHATLKMNLLSAGKPDAAKRFHCKA